MIANERAVPEDIYIEKHTQMEIGALATATYNRISRMEPADIVNLAKKLTAYVLRNEIDGGPINNQVVFHTYMTVNDILGGGIVVPESLINWSANA